MVSQRRNRNNGKLWGCRAEGTRLGTLWFLLDLLAQPGGERGVWLLGRVMAPPLRL